MTIGKIHLSVGKQVHFPSLFDFNSIEDYLQTQDIIYQNNVVLIVKRYNISSMCASHATYVSPVID